jgi:hypothetical protein
MKKTKQNNILCIRRHVSFSTCPILCCAPCYSSCSFFSGFHKFRSSQACMYKLFWYSIIFHIISRLDIPLCFCIIKGVKTVSTTLFVVFIAKGHHQAKYLFKHMKVYAIAFIKLRSQFLQFRFVLFYTCCFLWLIKMLILIVSVLFLCWILPQMYEMDWV